jgi:hypothetical protein
MSDEAKKKEDWADLCLSYHFDDGILWEYCSDGVYNVSGCAIIDVDNTLTRGPTLTENWLSSLYGDPKISRESPKINRALKTLRENPWDVKSAFDDIFLKILKKIPLKEKVYIDACLDAADNTAPPPGTRDLMFDLRDQNITRGVMTYGVEDALVPWYNYKITVPAFLRGTMPIFNNGYLVGYDMGGPYGKASFAHHFVNSLEFSPDQVIAIDDDPVIDKTMAAMLGVGLIVWLDKNEERREMAAKGLYTYPGKTPLVLEGVEDNMRLITDHVKRWKRMRFISETKSPIDIYRLAKEFDEMRAHLRLCKRDQKESHEHIRDLIITTERILNLGDPFIPRVMSDVGSLFSELRVGFYYTIAEPKELVRKADELCSLLEEQNPESRLTETHLEKMSQMLF